MRTKETCYNRPFVKELLKIGGWEYSPADKSACLGYLEHPIDLLW